MNQTVYIFALLENLSIRSFNKYLFIECLVYTRHYARHWMLGKDIHFIYYFCLSHTLFTLLESSMTRLVFYLYITVFFKNILFKQRYLKEKQANIEVILLFTVLIFSAHITFSFSSFYIGFSPVPLSDFSSKEFCSKTKGK